MYLGNVPESRRLRAQKLPSPEHGNFNSAEDPQEEDRPKSMSTSIRVVEFILAPWFLLVVMLSCFLLGGLYGMSFCIPFLMSIGLLFVCGAGTRWYYKQGKNAEVALGLICLTAMLMGIFVGVFVFIRYLTEYQRLAQGAFYFNVMPAELASGKSDATVLSFTNDTAVDQEVAYGFFDSKSFSIYCVAAVRGDRKDGQLGGPIEYWAAGIDCCDSRGAFRCGAATDAEAHAALVLPKTSSEQQGFIAAVKGAEAAFGVRSGAKRMLLHWSRDPLLAMSDLRSTAVMLVSVFAVVYLLISLMIAGALLPTLMVEAPK